MGFLDDNGLSHLWAKITAKFVPQVSGKGLSTNDYTTAEKDKLKGIAAGAQVNQNAFSNIKVGTKTVGADSVTDTLELEAGSNITLTPDTTSDKVTITAKDTTYSTFKGATSTPASAGGAGLVPAPGIGQVEYFLAGDGTWKKPEGKIYSDFRGATDTAKGEAGLVPAPDAGARGKVLMGNGTWDTLDLSSSFESERYIIHLLLGSDADAPEAKVYINAASGSSPGVMLPAEKEKLSAFQDASKYALKSDITGMYKYKGSVSDASKLPTSNRTAGDVYNIETAGQYGGAGMNVAWDGSKWDPLGDIFNVTAITNAEIDNICV